MDQRGISGWVCQAENSTPLIVDIMIDGRIIERGVRADIHRSDVQAAGFGSGHHGFFVPFHDGHLATDLRITPEKINVEVCDSSTGKPLLCKIFKTESFSRLNQSVSIDVRKIKVKIEKISPEGHFVGWAINPENPRQTVVLNLLIDGVHYTSIENTVARDDLRSHFQTDGKGGFQAHLPLRYLESGSHEVTVVASDGTSQTQSVVTEQEYSRPVMGDDNLSVEGTAVVVPIYNAADDVEVCIQRLIKYTDRSVELILIDDCSPDPRIAKILEEAASVSQVRVLRNEENLGFTRTVNRGLVEAGQRDVVILNSDARVTPRWLPNMLCAARSNPRVATVTAMSDRAGAFSAPDIGNENVLPPGVDEDVYARAFRRRQLGTYPKVPTGNGFCMLMTRAAMTDIGFLDEEGFPRGYGEENDYCMRAVRAGWQNLIDDRTYVFHDRTKSFGETKTEFAEAGARVVTDRYPEYRMMTSVYRDGQDILFARFQARLALNDCTKPEAILPRALFVVATSTGGTPQTNLDLMQSLTDTYDCWLLRCDGSNLELGHLVAGEVTSVLTHRLERRISPVTHRSFEYDRVVESWLGFYDFDLVHIRHLAWHSLNLPALAKALQMTVVHSFHDFYSLCPTVNLVKDGGFCSGNCSRTEGSCEPALWPSGSMPPVDRSWIAVWRGRYQEAIAHCDAFVTTSEPVRDRILAHLTELPAERFFVIPHGRDFAAFNGTPPTPKPNEPLRILLPGNISTIKGLSIINALIEHDVEGLLEIHLLGKFPPETPPHSRIVTHPSYTRNDFIERVRSINPHIGAVFTIVEETWCHTLTEMWSAGLPVAVFDFPTVAGRVRESGAGWILNHDNIEALYNDLLRIMVDQNELNRAYLAVRDWQSTVGSAETSRVMAAKYLDIYQWSESSIRGAPLSPMHSEAARIAVVCPGVSSDFSRANASTHIRVWQRIRNRPDRCIRYIKMHPEALIANLRVGAIHGTIIQRTAVPGPWVDHVIAASKAANIPYVVELDDDLLDVPPDKDPTGAYAAYVSRLERLVQQASALFVSTPFLRDRLSSRNDRIELIPNALSRAVWAMGDTPRQPDDEIRALYMGTKTHQADLDMILPALEAVAAKRQEFRLTIVGVGDSQLPEFAERIDIPFTEKDYPSFVRWLGELRRRVDFALAPLQETPFNESKSDLKVIDYGALGLPVLASRHRVFKHFSGHEGVTLVSNRKKDWENALLSHIDHRDRHREAGTKLRNWVFKHRSLEDTLDEYDQLVGDIIARRR